MRAAMYASGVAPLMARWCPLVLPPCSSFASCPPFPLRSNLVLVLRQRGRAGRGRRVVKVRARVAGMLKWERVRAREVAGRRERRRSARTAKTRRRATSQIRARARKPRWTHRSLPATRSLSKRWKKLGGSGICAKCFSTSLAIARWVAEEVARYVGFARVCACGCVLVRWRVCAVFTAWHCVSLVFGNEHACWQRKAKTHTAAAQS